MLFPSCRAFSLIENQKHKFYFDKEGRVLLFQHSDGERKLTNMVRLNVVGILSQAFMLVTELTSPFFGWWHAFAAASGVGFSLIGSGMLHFYSTRMIETMHLLKGGQFVEVSYLNAFFHPKTERLRIKDIGYYQPSRLVNVDYAQYRSKQKLYINLERNILHEPHIKEIVKKILTGTEVKLEELVKDEPQKKVEKKGAREVLRH